MSVKASKIQELLYGKIAAQIDSLLSTHGFKYQKSKKRFYRQTGKLDHIINFYTISSPLIYDEAEDTPALRFFLSACIEMPGFDKWYKEKINEPFLFSHRLTDGFLKVQAVLSFDDFTGDDFYTPTDAQRFKGRVSSLLSAGSVADSEYISLTSWLDEKVPELLSSFERESTVEKIFELREYPQSMIHVVFLHYNGFTELAKEHYDNNVKFSITRTEEKIREGNPDEIRNYTKGLNTLISVAEKTGIGIYENPFALTVKQLPGQEAKLELAPDLIYREKKRFTVSGLDINAVRVNDKDEILILSEQCRVIKLGADGTQLLDMKIEVPAGFDRLSWTKSGLLPGTNDFFVNNFIVKEDNSIVELAIPRNSEKKTKYLQNYHISGLAYSTEKEKYFLLYQDKFITYNNSGIQESVIQVNQTSNGGIYPEKEWLILQHGKQGYGVFNFEGQLISEHEVSGGNHEFALSPAGDFLAFFFYSTKSQLYNLITGKKYTLWAHPTLVKGYVETLYNDINHNFGMTCAAFSPDGTYLVGGADHGKYVAWRLPKAERVELIPDPAFIQMLQPETNRILINMDGSVGQHEEMKPGIVELEGQRFFVNRGNDITQFFFLDNGDRFITVLGSSHYVLTWDRNFTNRGYYKAEGHIDLHGTILSMRTKTELILFDRE